jgi:hypothetical protein
VRNAYKILVQYAERNRPNGRLRSKWENSVKMCLEATRCGFISRGNKLVHGTDKVMDSITCRNSLTCRTRTSVPRRTLLRGVITLQRRMVLAEWNWWHLTREEAQYEGTVQFWMKRPKSQGTCSCFGFEFCDSDYNTRCRNYINI